MDPYLYEDIRYRKWIVEVALAFFEGRQDEFVWMDLQKQFRNPEKQQIIPLNLTREIINETSVLYREPPIYRVVDKETGKILPKDQALWNQIQKDSKYLQTMDELDQMCRLLGTVLVKVSFVDNEGKYVTDTSVKGKIHLDILHSGVYDVKYYSSPYYISELMVGFGNDFMGFGWDKLNLDGSRKEVTQIYWSLNLHKTMTVKGRDIIEEKEYPNPYGIIPSVPFFNIKPAHFFFLPVNEPLLYANHAINMRMTDLNHIAKFQSFGVPVMTGVERGTSLRRGRPVDDFNFFKTGSPMRTIGNTAGGLRNINRNYDNYGYSDGNADANALGMSIGPDTAIAMGEKGDFRFESPKADISGLARVIQHMQDWVRINHGLQAKGNLDQPSKESGFSKMVSKIGVLEDNIRRQKLFQDREQHLFDVIKTMWNATYTENGDQKFSPNATLEITYVEPSFPLDPQTKIILIEGQRKVIESGDRRAIKELFKHLNESQIDELIKEHHKDRVAQMERELEIQEMQAEAMEESGLAYTASMDSGSAAVKAKGAGKKEGGIDNRLSHSTESSKQKGKNLDQRKKAKEKEDEKDKD